MPTKGNKITKQLTKRLVKKAGGVSNAAEACGTSAGMISQYCNPNRPQVINATSIIALTKVTQDASLINHIVKQCGLEDQEKAKADAFQMMLGLSLVHKEGSDFTTVATKALADRIVTPLEADAMIKEGLEFVAAIEDIIKLISTAGGVEITSKTEYPA